MNLRKRITILFALLFPIMVTAQNGNGLNLIPLPQEVNQKEGVFKLTPETVIVSKDKFTQNYLKEKIKKATNYDIVTSTIPVSGKQAIIFDVESGYSIPEEGYELSVNPNEIRVKASNGKGAFYGMQTLLQLMPAAIYGNATGEEKWVIPAVEIKDAPRFEYRGIMMDVSRTFFELDYIYQFLDWMAYHKLNKFHWHITDDNGWRIEIKKHPKLTQQGAWRGPNEVIPAAYGSGNKRYGGYYTQEQIKQVIKYASERGIEVIPEIDMPGHSKALTAVYPNIGCDNEEEYVSVNGEVRNIICVGKLDKNLKVIDDIIKEVAALFPSKILHMGGDEANFENWKNCKSCQDFMQKKGMKKEVELQHHFVHEIEKIVNKYGKTMAGWDEILENDSLTPGTWVYAWQTAKKGMESIERGFPTVMQIGEYCYFDMKQSPAERGHNWAGIVPLEKVYSFDPTGTFSLTPEQEKLVLGTQGAVWAELLNRPARISEYQYFPRSAAMSEVAWTNQDLRNYDDFYNRLTKTHYDRLHNMGIKFRVPPPAVTYEGNKLKVILPYEHAVVRYTTDASEPTASSIIYTGDITTHNPKDFRFATFFNNNNQSITVMADNVAPATYLTPETTIESSFEGSLAKFPISNATSYDFDKNWRTTRKGKAGDYTIYKFKEPVDCKKITIETGNSNISFYSVTDGYVEYSYDGKNWIKGEQFVNGIAEITPEKPVKEVKIIFTGGTDGYTVCFQSPRIEAK